MAVAARANAKRLDMAVALLEHGYTDDQVEAAVDKYRTLDKALAWLAANNSKPLTQQLKLVMALPIPNMSRLPQVVMTL